MQQAYEQANQVIEMAKMCIRDRQGRPVSASTVRCSVSDHGSRQFSEKYGKGSDRSSTAGIYERTYSRQ